MIVLRTRNRSRVARTVKLLVLLLGTAISAVAGAGMIAEIMQAWTDNNYRMLVFGLCALLGAFAGMYIAGRSIATELTGGEPGECIIVARNTMALKTAGQPASFLNRSDFVAARDDGATLERRNGRLVELRVPGNRRKDLDFFLDSLYDLWWPEHSFTLVRDRLRDGPAPKILRLGVSSVLATSTAVCAVLAIEYDLRLFLAVAALFTAQSIYFLKVEVPRFRKAQVENRYPLSAPIAQDP